MKLLSARIIEIMIVVFMLLVIVALKQAVEANPALFDITEESELPEHYANLFFGQMDADAQLSLLLKISAFVWAKSNRNLAENIHSKISNNEQSTTSVKPVQKGKRKGNSDSRQRKKSAATEPASSTMATQNRNALKGLMQKLGEMEKLPGSGVTRENIKSLDNIWTILNNVLEDKRSFDEINVETMIKDKEEVGSSNTATVANFDWAKMAPLHMEKIKHLLVSKKSTKIKGNNNKLAEAFEQRHMGEEKEISEIVDSKEKMRGLVGTTMFQELEMKEPLLLRIDRAEDGELLRSYQQLFSSPVQSAKWKEAKLQLEIRYLFGEVLRLSKEYYTIVTDSIDSDEITNRIHKWEHKEFKSREYTPEMMLAKLFQAYDKLCSDVRPFSTIPIWEDALQNIHQENLTKIYYNDEQGKFMQFLDENPEARARVNTILGAKMPEIERKLMDFVWNHTTITTQLADNYHRLAVANDENETDTESKLTQLKARVNVDVKLQLYLMEYNVLKEKAKGMHDDESSSPWWDNFRKRILLFLAYAMETNRKSFVEIYARSLNNMLYKFKILLDTTGKQWDEELKAHMYSSLASLNVLKKREEMNLDLEPAGHTEPPLLEPEKRAEWLGMAHQVMVQVLVTDARTEATQQLRDLSDEQIMQLEKTLNDGPDKEIRKMYWLEFIEQRHKPHPQITGQPAEEKNKNPAEGDETTEENAAAEGKQEEATKVATNRQAKTSIVVEVMEEEKLGKSDMVNDEKKKDFELERKNGKNAMDEEKSPLVTVEAKKEDKDEKEKKSKQKQQKEESVYFECPTEGIMTNKLNISQIPYVPLLMKGGLEAADLESMKREANLDMLEWQYRKSIMNMLISDAGLRNKEPFALAWKEWSELSTQCAKKKDLVSGKGINTVHNSRLIELKEQIVCKFHHFLIHQILNNEQMAQIDESKWIELLENMGFKETLINWLREVPTVNCENSQQATDAVNLLLEHPDLPDAHFEYLDWLMRKSEEFQRFLCDNENDPLLVKGRLLELINPLALDELEIMHPELLKIDKMHPKMRLHLYGIYMSHRSGTPESMASELRIAIALLIEVHNKMEEDFGDLPGMGGSNLRKKVLWLKQRIFLDDRAIPAVSMRNICLLVRFNDFVGNLGLIYMDKKKNGTLIPKEKKKKDKKVAAAKKKKVTATASAESDLEDGLIYESLLNAWDDEEICQEFEGQEDAMLKQWDRLVPDHQAFFIKYKEAVLMMLNEPGMRTRIYKLMFSTEIFFGKYDRNALTNIVQLRKQINDFFFDKDPETHLSAHLGVIFIVWSRWMEAQLARKPKSPEAEAAKEVWQKIEQELLENFDRIFDQDAKELEKGVNDWARVQEIVANYLLRGTIKFPMYATMKKLREWKELVTERIIGILQNMDAHEEGWNAERFEKAKLSVAIKNREALLLLLSGNAEEDVTLLPSFKNMLLQAFENNVEAKKRLPKLVGEAGVKPVAEELGWEEWKPEEFRLTTEKMHSAEKKERELLVNAKKEKMMSEKSVDEIAKELLISTTAESVTVSTAKASIKQKASKKKGATKININKSLSSPSTVVTARNSSSESASEANAKESSLLTTIHDSETGSTSASTAMDDAALEAQKATASESVESGSSSLQGETTAAVLISKSAKKKKKKSASKLSSKASGDINTTFEAEHSELKESEPKQSGHKFIVEHSTTSPADDSTDAALKKQQSSSGLFKRKIMSAIQKWKQAKLTEPLLEILRTKGLLLKRPASDTSTGFSTTDLDQNIEKTIGKLKDIVRSWKKEAILLKGGSYLLQLNTADSDIDCILLLPFEEKNDRDWMDLYVQHYFGNQIGPNDDVKEVLCNLESLERHCPADKSLYCILCKDRAVTSLQKRFGRNNDPMILLQFHGIQFDISFVPIPNEIRASNSTEKQQLEAIIPTSENEEEIMSILSSVKKVDKMIAYFIDWWKNINNMDGRKGMLWALSGYRANLRMCDLLKGKPIDTFRSALLALKLWAKNHHVYSAKLGLLNGSMLTIMLLHVFLENVHDPIPSLLAKFFHTFIHWKWPKPLKLQGAFNEEHKKYAELDWNESSEKNDRGNQFYEHLFLAEEFVQLVWPVILPGFPTQNPAFNVNRWTSRAMLNEFGKGFTQMETIQKAILSGNGALNMIAIQQQWDAWFYDGKFHEKYDHFVTIFCAAHSVQHVRTFCDYVESRIRLQLLFSFGDLSSQMKWMHVSPQRVHDALPCPTEANVHLPDGKGKGKWLCTTWLVGIQLVDEEGMKQDIREILEQQKFLTDPQKMSRLEMFAEKISTDFDQKQKHNKREALTEKVLIAKYMPKENFD